MSGPGDAHDSQSSAAGGQMRASKLLRVRAVWVTPIVLASVVVFLMTLIYFGSVVDPASHLSGLPVLIVNQDRGAQVAGTRADIGEKVVAGLVGTPAVTSRLRLTTVTWAEAQERMNRGDDYAAVVIPLGFTTSLLALAGVSSNGEPAPQKPTVEIRTNQRLGTLGTSLATGVLQPAMQAVSAHPGPYSAVT